MYAAIGAAIARDPFFFAAFEFLSVEECGASVFHKWQAEVVRAVCEEFAGTVVSVERDHGLIVD